MLRNTGPYGYPKATYTEAAAIDATIAVSGQRSRTASAAGPTRRRTTASASIPLRSDWLFAAPNEPATWNTATASAVSTMAPREVDRIGFTVGLRSLPVVTHRTYPVLRSEE